MIGSVESQFLESQLFCKFSAKCQIPDFLRSVPVPHPPVLTQHSTIRMMPPWAQAALLMGMIFFVSVSLLFFDFLLEEESQQRQQEEDDQFIEGVA